MNVEKVLFALLRYALWGEELGQDIDAGEVVAAMELAKQQTVVGLLYDGVQRFPSGKVPLPRKDLLKWFALADKIRKRNVLVNQELTRLVSCLESHGIDYIVVKGQTVGASYPKPWLRQPGDIDFLIRDSYAAVRDSISSLLDVALPKQIIEKEAVFKKNEVLFELHTDLTLFGSKANQRFWDELIAQSWTEHCCVEVDGTTVRTLPPTLNVAYVFIHLFFHFIREDVGLRQFCDWAVLLHAYGKAIDRDRLAEILKKLDMLNAYRAFGSILTDELGLSEADFPFPIGDKDRRWKKRILADLFGSGCSGVLNRKATSSWGYKMETLKYVVRNSLLYYRLAPTEMRLIIPHKIKINWDLYSKKRNT